MVLALDVFTVGWFMTLLIGYLYDHKSAVFSSIDMQKYLVCLGLVRRSKRTTPVAFQVAPRRQVSEAPSAYEVVSDRGERTQPSGAT